MSQDSSQIECGRRPLAVGIWSFLVMLMPLTGTHVSSELSFWVLILVSLLCTAAILIDDEIQSRGKSNSGFRRHLPVVISISIAILWAIFLGEKTRPFLGSGPAIIGLFPVMFAAVWRTLRLGNLPNDIPGRVQAAEKTCPLQTVIEATPPRTFDESSEAEATSRVPFSQTASSDLDEFSEESGVDPWNFGQRDNVTHWLTRSKSTDKEIIEGGVRVEFAGGQRDITVHISFCPAFASVPTIDTEDLDGDGLEIRVAAVFPFGARLTVRRSAISKSDDTADSTGSGRIGFVATAVGDVRRVA